VSWFGAVSPGVAAGAEAGGSELAGGAVDSVAAGGASGASCAPTPDLNTAGAVSVLMMSKIENDSLLMVLLLRFLILEETSLYIDFDRCAM
jgi:hypothetical protein